MIKRNQERSGECVQPKTFVKRFKGVEMHFSRWCWESLSKLKDLQHVRFNSSIPSVMHLLVSGL